MGRCFCYDPQLDSKSASLKRIEDELDRRRRRSRRGGSRRRGSRRKGSRGQGTEEGCNVCVTPLEGQGKYLDGTMQWAICLLPCLLANIMLNLSIRPADSVGIYIWWKAKKSGRDERKIYIRPTQSSATFKELQQYQICRYEVLQTWTALARRDILMFTIDDVHS